MTSNAFAIKPGVGARLYLGKSLVLCADIETLVADHDFDGGVEQQTGIFNFNAGIGARF